MRWPATKAHLAALLVVLASCSDADRTASMTEQDSAGISMTSLTPVKNWPQQGVLAGHPLLTLRGATSADRQLGNGFWIPAAILSDRSLVIGDGSRFFVFGKDGRFIDVIGRKGDGPGEFRDLRTICAGRGDTLLLVDDGRRVATVYDLPSRAVVRQFPTIQQVYPGSCSSSLTILVPGLPVPDAPDAHPAARFELRNIVGDTVTEYSDLPTASYGKVWSEPSFAFRADSLFVTDGQRMEVEVYGPDATLSRVVRVRERLDDRNSQVAPVSEAPTAGTRARAAKPPDGVRPNYKTFKLGSDGRYWFLTQVDGVTEGRWAAVSADGHPIGTLSLPKRSGEFRILEFLGDTVLVSEEREDGQRRLAKYQILWSNLSASDS